MINWTKISVQLALSSHCHPERRPTRTPPNAIFNCPLSIVHSQLPPTPRHPERRPTPTPCHPERGPPGPESRDLPGPNADVDVSLISLEDLKINKAAAGRHKDLTDLEQLP